MSLYEKLYASFMLMVGAGALTCMFAMWWAGRWGPSTAEREAVEDAPPTVVAGSDLQFQADLAQVLAEAEAILAEGMPGEGR